MTGYSSILCNSIDISSPFLQNEGLFLFHVQIHPPPKSFFFTYSSIYLFIYFSSSQLSVAATDYFNGLLLTHVYKVHLQRGDDH